METYKTIDPNDVDALINDGAVALDIRDEAKYNVGHINGAINIYKAKIISKDFTGLDKSKTYIVYCGSGNSAKMASKAMFEEGFNIFYLNGGYAGYINK
jgi:rhodanese-related sulfurtransferase